MKIKHRADDLKYEGEFQYDEATTDSQFWSLLLLDEEKNYFADVKKFGFQVTGSYSIKGKKYECKPG